MMPSLVALPDELLHQILRHTAPEQALRSVALVSRRFNRLTEERLLWKYYCKTSFRYWQTSHRFWDKVRGNLHDVDWKALYLLRLKRNRHIASLIDDIVASRVSRIEKTEQICRYGFDAKDYLLTQSRIDDSVPDALARSYYSCAALNSIHRSLAIEEWAKFQEYYRSGGDESSTQRLNGGMRLERAIGAFDMFILHDNEGDLDEISALLDDMAARFRTANPRLHLATTREKAIALARWLHFNNLAGLDADEDSVYHLRNCLIGRALRDDQHLPLPIVSAVIFAALAPRCGFEAYPCAPVYSQVHVVVLSQRGVSLDGARLRPEEAEHQETMYFNLYWSADEVPAEHVNYLLSGQGLHNGQQDFLTPASTDQIVVKTAENIRSSFTKFGTFDRPVSQLIPIIGSNKADSIRDLDPATYSTHWATIMMTASRPDHEIALWGWRRSVWQLLASTLASFPEDSWLVEKYICPMYDSFSSPQDPQSNREHPSQQIRNKLRLLRRADRTADAPTRRSRLAEGIQVKYRVGQVFRHKRYDYYGIILGWTTDGLWGDPTWTRGSPLVKREYTHPYYHCLVSRHGYDQHIMAEHSIEAIKLRGGVEALPAEIRDLMPVAGRYFKRWDGERGVFVSNRRELYPED
ncbi:hypothetical protein F4861DRAFT_498031 [Xylaria intraflava]|nr:hypothetical protein F4861DRAFT_498031 [Xylaria intraflava]